MSIAFACASSPVSAESKQCTAEAMICPDGSTVGRSGPNCEFAPCPSAQGNYGVPATGETGIKGKAMLGPTCPVVSNADDRCQDKPFQGTLIIREGTTIREVSRVQTDPDGAFQSSLAPGHYTIVSEGDTMYPRCGTEVDVPPGQFTDVVLHCDSGIR